MEITHQPVNVKTNKDVLEDYQRRYKGELIDNGFQIYPNLKNQYPLYVFDDQKK